MSNPCMANSSEVAAIFNAWKQTHARGLENTSLLRREKKNLWKRPAVQYSFQPSICYCHKLFIFKGFYTSINIFWCKWMKWSPMPWGLLWTEKIGWSREKQIEINSTREQAPLCFLKVRSTISTKNK